MQSVFIAIVTGYLLGSIPWGYVVGKWHGVDIRQHGSGNIGATNVFRTLGRKWGVLVFVLDALKGALAVRFAMDGLAAAPHTGWFSLNIAHSWAAFRVDQVPCDQFLGILAGLGCFLGHCFPVWLGFKGGKGVAVGAGILFGLTPLVAVLGLTVWGVAFQLTRYVSLASVLAALSLPLFARLLDRQSGVIFWFCTVISALSIWRHRGNIQRLLAGTESRFEKKK